jgi:hypothetical protein
VDNVAQFPAGISIFLAQISFGINRLGQFASPVLWIAYENMQGSLLGKLTVDAGLHVSHCHGRQPDAVVFDVHEPCVFR